MAVKGKVIFDAVFCLCQKFPLIQTEANNVASIPIKIKAGAAIVKKSQWEYAIR